jgi:hypothetical protein
MMVSLSRAGFSALPRRLYAEGRRLPSLCATISSIRRQIRPRELSVRQPGERKARNSCASAIFVGKIAEARTGARVRFPEIEAAVQSPLRLSRSLAEALGWYSGQRTTGCGGYLPGSSGHKMNVDVCVLM